MATITDPEAIRFVNEVVRPMSEEGRGFAVRRNALSNIWFGGMDAQFANGADTVEDGREAEGVSRLTAQQVKDAVQQILGMNPNAEIIQKPCVRPLP